MFGQFQGIYAALITPYTSDGQVNYNELKKLVRYLINKGIDGFYVGGTTAEAFLLSQDERKNILEAVLEENNGEKKVIAHVGQMSTALACDLARHAESVNADAISAVPPFYYKFNSDEIVNYYLDIMDASTVPMFVYNIPALSGVTVSPQMIDELSKGGNLAGIKFTSNDFYDMAIMRKEHPELTIWNGYDEILTEGLACGADGAIGSTYNVLCPIAKKIYESVKDKNLEEARKYQNLINEEVSYGRKYSFGTQLVKMVLDLDGFSIGGCRKPFKPLPESAKEDAQAIYENLVVPFK